MPTAAVIVIGDEILSGKFADENGPFPIRRLRQIGADLERLVVIGDAIDDIAREVRYCAETYDVVFTTGGVGPTHDDLTLQGIARAFDLELEVREELVALLQGFGIEASAPALQMATLPAGSELIHLETASYPVLKVRNVHVFPGVPRLMQAKFDGIAQRFEGQPMQTARVCTDRRETEIAATLIEVQQRWPEVALGSYPRIDDGPYRLILTLESRNTAALAEAEAELRRLVPVQDGPEDQGGVGR